MTKKATQNQAIIMELRKRGDAGYTPLDALYGVGCFRLAARIEELRHLGHNITTTIETTQGTGKRIARYRLIES